MKSKLEQIKDEVLEKLKDVKELNALKELETKYLGRKGEIADLFKKIVDLTMEEKKEFGRFANMVKNDIQKGFAEVKGRLEGKKNESSFFDVGLPGEKIKRGHKNPITIVQEDMEDLFNSLGFMVLDGPELESDYYNFEAINIPSSHPARDMQDTFYVENSLFTKDAEVKDEKSDLVLRTHTSSVQVRAMQEHGAPIKCVIPGRVFRCEATDVRHEHTFYQIEGMMVDKDINFSHLKGVLEIIGKHLYGEDTELRMRPKFYPFVEPGVNLEYTCFICKGKGCKLCKHTGWLEIAGAGIMHPEVLKAGNVDPEEYTGFAFGFGLNRLVMLKYGIDDIRNFNGGDLRFVSQF